MPKKINKKIINSTNSQWLISPNIINCVDTEINVENSMENHERVQFEMKKRERRKTARNLWFCMSWNFNKWEFTGIICRLLGVLFIYTGNYVKTCNVGKCRIMKCFEMYFCRKDENFLHNNKCAREKIYYAEFFACLTVNTSTLH